MEKLTNKRIYLDFNATSPPVFQLGGDVFYANPSGISSSSKKSMQAIKEVEKYFLNLFNLDNHRIIFHSGASEGIQTFFNGMLKKFNKPSVFIVFNTDHAAVLSLKNDVLNAGHHWLEFTFDEDGQCSIDNIIQTILEWEAKNIEVAMNITAVNNETGFVFPLVYIDKLKSLTKAIVHVDAVQSIGKVEHFLKLNKDVEMHTYSGHKFGSQMGVGFSILKNNFKLAPLIGGGSQQNGERGGTLNVAGIVSLKVAMEFLINHFNYSELKSCQSEIHEYLCEKMKLFGMVIGKNSSHKNLNTFLLAFNQRYHGIIFPLFDLQGLDVSVGSACSSRIGLKNRIVLALGLSEELAKGTIRLSFGPYLTKTEWEESIKPNLSAVFNQLKY